jgi:hypothetical protein
MLATGVHTAAYLAVTGLLAWVVYRKLGLAILRKGWLNFDLVWAAALVATGGNRAPEFITCRHEESSGQASSVVSSPAGELGSDSSRIEPLEVAVA